MATIPKRDISMTKDVSEKRIAVKKNKTKIIPEKLLFKRLFIL